LKTNQWKVDNSLHRWCKQIDYLLRSI